MKLVYKTKLKKHGEIDKYKTCLIAIGCKHEDDINYKKVFTLFANHDTIILIIILITQSLWLIFQLDVKLTFLHRDLKKQVFVDQPPSYVKFGNDQKVYS